MFLFTSGCGWRSPRSSWSPRADGAAPRAMSAEVAVRAEPRPADRAACRRGNTSPRSTATSCADATLQHVGLLAAVVLAWAVIFDMASALLSGPIVGQYAALVPTILLVALFSTGIRNVGLVGRQHAQIEEDARPESGGRTGFAQGAGRPASSSYPRSTICSAWRTRVPPAAADGIAQPSYRPRHLIDESRAERVELAKEADQYRRLVELEEAGVSPKTTPSR